MSIAVIGYKFNNARITVEYDTVERGYYINEILEIGECEEEFNYKVKTKKEALDILKNFKKVHKYIMNKY